MRFRNLCVALVVLAIGVSACSEKKKIALEAIRRDVKEEGLCTLPIGVIAVMKQQFSSKAVCILKGDKRGGACFNALVTAGVTTAMGSFYMTDWPDEMATQSLKDLPAFERRSRNDLFETCVAMKDGLREGKFSCADVAVDKVTDTEKLEKGHLKATYKRTVTYKRDLAPIDAACGSIVRVPEEASVTLTKGEDGTWKVDATP